MRAYSLDLRQRVIEAFSAGQSHQEIADRFAINRSSVWRYIRLGRQGQLAPSNHRTPSRKRLIHQPEIQATVCALVAEDNDATLAEYCERLMDRVGAHMSIQGMSRFLQRLNLRRKKRRPMRASGKRPRSSRRASASTPSMRR